MSVSLTNRAWCSSDSASGSSRIVRTVRVVRVVRRTDRSLAEDACKRQGEFRQQICRQHVARFARQLDGTSESAVATPRVDAYHIDVRVDDPVLGYAGALVQMPLDGFVTLPRAR